MEGEAETPHLEVSRRPRTACVTGGNGYIGCALVEGLISRGWNVHATVRDAKDAGKTSQLRCLQRADGALKTFSATMGATESCVEEFADAFNGCDVVFHCAAPVTMTGTQETLVDPIVKGTESVLAAISRCPTVKRLVYTSSVAACVDILNPENQGKTFDENDWNLTSTLEKAPYRLAKRLAEQLVWEWAAKSPTVAVTSICPFLVVGTIRAVKTENGAPLNYSVEVIQRYLSGAHISSFPGYSFGISDLDDVVAAHVLAVESDKTLCQRYLCVGHVLPWADLVAALRELAPDAASKLPTVQEGPSIHFQISSAKLMRDLGITFVPLEETLLKTIQGLREGGWWVGSNE